MIFRDELRQLRKNKKLTFRQLSKKSGVSASYIMMLEGGLLKNPPSPLVANKLDRALSSNALTELSLTSIIQRAKNKIKDWRRR